jgi:hypothetical protein
MGEPLLKISGPWPEDRVVVPIDLSVDLSAKYQNVEERYYTPYFFAAQADGEDQVVLVHSNRVCLVSLAPNHPVILQKKPIKNLDFDVSKNCNRLSVRFLNFELKLRAAAGLRSSKITEIFQMSLTTLFLLF